jgi:ribose transport system permease protein
VPTTASLLSLAKRTNPFRRQSSFEAKSFLALLGIVVLAGVTSPTTFSGSNIFFQLGNLTDVLRQVSLIGIISLAMTFVILTAGIDLSVGSLLAFSSAATAMCLTRYWNGSSVPLHLFFAIVTAIALTTLLGILNGVVIAKLRVQPFIVTLASMIGVRGLAKWGTNNENIDLGFGTDAASRFAAIFRTKSIVIGSYIMLAMVFGVVLTRTVFGRYVRAIGDNEKAALYTGLPLQSIKIWVYALSGLLSGYAGVLYAAANHQGNPNSGNAYELDAIAAVVIGGTPLSGGRGSIIGTVLGTLIMGVLTNMLRLNNVDSNAEMMIKAVIIVLAVVIQRERKLA